MENQANPVPDYIKEADKTLVFAKVESDYHDSTVLFCSFMDKNHLTDYDRDYNVLLKNILPEIDYTHRMQRALCPIWEEGGFIEGYTSILDIYRKRPVTMKAGKYIRKIAPFLTDAQVEKAVSTLKKLHSPIEFELIESKDADSFQYAYSTSHCLKRSPSFKHEGFNVRRLDSSCMKGEFFEGWANHPAKVYGFGDLAILYAKQKGKDHIGARVVIWPDKMSCQDIYTSDDNATKLISEYLTKKGYTDRGINGAGVSKIPYDQGYLMPYVDGIDTCEDMGDHFLLGYGSIPCTSTEGYVYEEESLYCQRCGNNFPEKGITQVDNQTLCFCCRDESYTYSDLMDKYIHNDDVESSGDGEVATGSYFEDNWYVLDYEGVWQVESGCVEYEGEYYHESSHYVTTFNGINYHEDSPELIDAQEAKEKEGGAYQTIKTESFGWYLIPEINLYGNTQLIPTMGLIVSEERVLRDNYQINSEGVPERLPELPFDLVDLTPELACV